MKDLFGNALLDYYHGKFQPPLLLHNQYGEPEIIPVETYFRGPADFTDLEHFALSHVNGSTLDIGAAAGRHALYLQENNIQITAMDISPKCELLMREQGVLNIVTQDIMNHIDARYDTLIMLMNGIGIAGSLDGLEKLLLHLKNIVQPGGQILLDSTDISYLFEGTDFPEEPYFGQLEFRYEYQKEIDEPFSWLYIDQETLTSISEKYHWRCQIIFEDETDAYLARLTHA